MNNDPLRETIYDLLKTQQLEEYIPLHHSAQYIDSPATWR